MVPIFLVPPFQGIAPFLYPLKNQKTSGINKGKYENTYDFYTLNFLTMMC